MEAALRDRFAISRGGVDRVRTVLIRMTFDEVTGIGEATAVKYHGESQESMLAVIPRMAALLKSENPMNRVQIYQRLMEEFPKDRGAISGVDMALYDWWGKKEKQPVWRLLGGDPAKAPATSYTIGLDSLEVMLRKVSETTYPILKIKMGAPGDLETLEKIRALVPDRELRVDPNEGWSVEQTLENLSTLNRLGVTVLEQPVQREDVEGLRRIREKSSIPLFADESVQRAEDLERLRGAVDGVNLKLSKCGGITGGLDFLQRARDLEFKVMIGCMTSTSLAIAAALPLAPWVDYLDLDAHLLVSDEPMDGVEMEGGGRFRFTSIPGFGVERRNAKR